MQIICPDCGSKNPAEAGALATQTRFSCAVCGVEFAAVLSDERVEAEAAPAAPAGERRVEIVQGRVFEYSPETGDMYEVLALPEELLLPQVGSPAASEQATDRANVLEDLFEAPPPAQSYEAEADENQAVVASAFPEGGLEPALVQFEQHSEESRDEPRGDDALVSDDVYDSDDAQVSAAFAGEHLTACAAQSFDKYSLGVRLMRVSPLWLLVSGLAFISFIVFCNWFFVPANVAQSDAPRSAPLRNQATNQSAGPVVAASDVAATRPGAQNSSGQTSAPPAEPEAEEQPSSAPTQMPAPSVKHSAPPVERSARARSESLAAEAADAARPAGKFVVQVGSYNVAAEAEARAANLKAAGLAARVVEVEIPKRGRWHRVVVGGFASREEAEAHGRQLRGRGLTASYFTTEVQ